jgi:hypothetical protein
MPSQTEKSIETRARRLAAREGYLIRKSRTGLSHNNQGQFMLIDDRNYIRGGEHFDMSAADVLEYFA